MSAPVAYTVWCQTMLRPLAEPERLPDLDPAIAARLLANTGAGHPRLEEADGHDGAEHERMRWMARP
jgi:hypothetical protein